MRHPRLYQRLVAGALALVAVYVAANVGFYLIRSYRAYRAELQGVSEDMVERIRDSYDSILGETIRTVLVATDQSGSFREALLGYDGSYEHRVAVLNGLSQIQAAVPPVQSVYAYLAPSGRVFSLETGGFYSEQEFYDGGAVSLMDRVTGVIVRHDRRLTYYGTERSYASVAFRVKSPLAHAAVVVNLSDDLLARAVIESAPGAIDYDLDIRSPDDLAEREDGEPIVSSAIRATARSTSFDRVFVLEIGAAGMSAALSATASFAGISLAAAALLFGGFTLLIVKSLKPLDRLFARVRLADAESDAADLPALEDYLTRLMSDNDRLQREYRRLIPESRKELLRELFSGHVTNTARLEERLRFNGITEPEKGLVAACLLLDVQDLPEQRRLEASAVVEDLLSERLDNQNRGFHVLIGRNQYALAVPSESDSPTIAELEAPFVRLLGEAPDPIRVRIAVGVGLPADGFQGLVGSYEQAQAALGYRRTFGTPIICAATVESLKGRRYRYPYERERLLIERLQSGDESGSLSILHEMLDQIVADRLGDREIEYLRLQLIHALNRYLYEHGLSVDQEERLYREYDTAHARSIDEVREILTGIVRRIAEAQHEHRAASRRDLVDRFLEHIQANSCVAAYQLLDMEEEFGLNRYYIGQLISEHTGRHFNDHLNEARVAHAAEILSAEPDAAVKEVALRVGYAYPYYFIRQFKRIRGVTPKVFRDSSARRTIR